MNKIFLSKDNTSKLYKEILKENNLQALPRKSKEIIVDNLVSNMKEVYKHIDQSKINNNNVSGILGQFNNMCVTETTKQLKTSDVFSGEDTQVSRLKFARDFKSTPQKQVKFLERPQSVTTNRPEPRQVNQIENNIRGPSNSLDNMFQPITGSNFNDANIGYTNKSDSYTDINKRMDMVSQMRQREENINNQRPPTPDFLKTQRTQSNKPDEPQQTNYNNNFNDNSNMNFQPTMNNYNSNDNNQSNEIGAVNSGSIQQENTDLASYSGGGDYFNFDDVNKPIMQNDIVEDGASFEDRLKRLHADRDSFNLTQPQNVPPKQSAPAQQDQYQQNSQQNNNDYLKKQQEILAMRYQEEEKLKLQQQSQEEGNSSKQQEQLRYQQEQEQLRYQQEQEQLKYQEQEQLKYQQEQEQLRYQQEQEQMRYKQENKESNSSDLSLKILLEKLNNLEKSNDSSLLKTVNDLKSENQNLKNDLDQLNNVKKKIAEEFTELNKKNDIVTSNLQILNQRELELNSRENEITQLISSYKDILNARFYQMNVTSKENKSLYSYFFNSLENIISIKIISYSLPQPRFNVDINNCNMKYKIYSDEENFEEKEINLKKGKYTIENLLEKLSYDSELNFELSLEQQVKILSEKKFELEKSNLINNTLGFSENDEVKNENEKYYLEASNSWDLRIHDKLYLYIRNINDDPISIIYFNGSSETQIQFEDPIELSQLDIEIRDSNNNLYDFNNLSHSINLQFELTNQFLPLEVNKEIVTEN